MSLNLQISNIKKRTRREHLEYGIILFLKRVAKRDEVAHQFDNCLNKENIWTHRLSLLPHITYSLLSNYSSTEDKRLPWLGLLGNGPSWLSLSEAIVRLASHLISVREFLIVLLFLVFSLFFVCFHHCSWFFVSPSSRIPKSASYSCTLSDLKRARGTT